MSTYRPITDVWILARPKVAYYGAFPSGFLHRARALLGVRPLDVVLHVCAGKVREYPYAGIGVNDRTVDADPACAPDYVMDVREGLPVGHWDAVLIDRPYSPEDAARYAPGVDKLPNVNQLLRAAIDCVEPGHRVGVLDYVWPHPPKDATEVAVIAVGTGRNNRARWFTVFQKVAIPRTRSQDV